ncbi:unnamed protein product, partial [Brassica rapa]
CSPLTSEGLTEAIVKLPLLEELDVSYCSLSVESLKVVGQSLPNLKTLKLNRQSCPNLKKLRLNSETNHQFNDEELNDKKALGIAESMPELRHLQLVGNTLTNRGLTAILDGCPHLEHLDLRKSLGKLPLLEELELSRYTLSGDSLKVVGQSCPKLKTLKLHSLEIRPPGYGNDDDALAIAETMHGLRFLLLFGNCLTKVGLNAILDNCLDLEHLDLRLCFNFKLVGDLEKRCSERIKVLRRPFDSPDCPYDEREIHADISDDEVPFVPDVNSYGVFENTFHIIFLFNMSSGLVIPLYLTMELRLYDHQTKMASSPLTPVMKEDGECRNWSELPYELMASILSRLDTIDILENAQKVCTSWHRVCKDPAMWRKIDFRYFGDKKYNLEIMCRHAVDLSQGGLLEIDISCFGTDSLLNYIADRSSNLRSLELALISVTTEGLAEAIGKLPSHEELKITEFAMWGGYLKVVGQSCPKLKTLNLNCIRIGFDPPFYVSDDDALDIAETMHGLRFLQLFSNGLTDAGLKAILDNCPDLEHLDLNHCFNVNFSGDLEKRCSERIKVLVRPGSPRIFDFSIFEDSVTLDSDHDQ